MTHIQVVVDALFERFPPEELGGGSERGQFERLRSTLTETEEWPGTLRRLYQAEQCDELALGLMWLTERLGAEPERREPGPEEEEVFFRALRRGLGLQQAEFGRFAAEAMPTFSEPQPDQTGAGPGDVASEPVVSPFTEGGPETEGTSDPEIFGRILERFLEAVQSGSDDRASLLERLRASCTMIGSDASTGEEYQRYAVLIRDFLSYISEHQLLDDVRVMNLVTNIQDPFGQWLSTPEGDRAGILDQCHEMHKDFRTMFE